MEGGRELDPSPNGGSIGYVVILYPHPIMEYILLNIVCLFLWVRSRTCGEFPFLGRKSNPGEYPPPRPPPDSESES